MSIDPVTFLQSGDPAMFNRYAYANNDPVNRIDPDGRQSCGYLCRDLRKYGTPREVFDNSTNAAVKGVTVAAGTAADFTPVLGDAKAIGEAIANPTKANIAAAAVGIVPIVGDVAGKGIKVADGAISTTTKARKASGADGATSAMTKESINGPTTSMRHTVTNDGKILHQHQEHFGSSGSTKRFSDEMTGSDTINAPDHIDTGPRLDKE